MRLTEYIDYLNNGKKNVKRYTHYDPNSKSSRSGSTKLSKRQEEYDEKR